MTRFCRDIFRFNPLCKLKSGHRAYEPQIFERQCFVDRSGVPSIDFVFLIIDVPKVLIRYFGLSLIAGKTRGPKVCNTHRI